MTSQSGSSTSKTPDIATFSSEVSNALKTTQQLQDNVHKLLQTFIEWSSHESEESLTKVKETIKEIQSCQRLEYVHSLYLLTFELYFFNAKDVDQFSVTKVVLLIYRDMYSV